MPNRTKYDPETDEPLTDLRRPRLFINDEPCIERDYSALHLILLYAQRGIDYWTEYKGDPYEVPNPVYPDENRTLGKLMTLLAINAASRQSTFSAVNNELRDINLPPLKYDQFNAHFDQLMAKHDPIAESFFADEGIKLQFIDSQIVEIVIREFARQSDNSSGYRYMSEITYRPHARRIGQSYFIYAQDFDLNGDHLKNQIIGGGLSYQLSYGRYFGSFSSRYSERKFENIDPFWGNLRKDETINAAIELCRATVRRFSVCLRYAHEETESTIDFYDNEGPDYGLYVRGAVF
jgi:hypothetical protein